MFGVDSSELFLIVLVAVMVIGPKDLPRVMRSVGNWVGKARGMASQFRLGVDQMMRETEIAELEKKWREQNEAIMKAHPMAQPESDWGKPEAEPAPALAETAAPSLDKSPPPRLDKPVPPPRSISGPETLSSGPMSLNTRRRPPRIAASSPDPAP